MVEMLLNVYALKDICACCVVIFVGDIAFARICLIYMLHSGSNFPRMFSSLITRGVFITYHIVPHSLLRATFSHDGE